MESDQPPLAESVAPLPDRGTGQAYLLFAASMFLLLSVGVAVQLWAPIPGLVITELFLILLPAVLFVRLKGLAVTDGLRLKSVSPGTVMMSVAVGVTAWGVAMGLYVLGTMVLGNMPEIAMFRVETGAQLAVLLVVAAVLPGVCEEALFRGAIMGVLERRGTWRSVIATAALFAFFHLDPWRLVPTFFLGLVMGALVVRTSSVFPAMLAHTANNATAMTADYLLRDRTEEATHLLWYLIPAFVICMAAFWKVTSGRFNAVSPLASISAGLSRSVARWLKVSLVAAIVLMALLVVGIISAFDFPLIESPDLASYLNEGERAVVALDPSDGRPIAVDEIVYYRTAPKEGATLGRVVRADAERVWIAATEGALELRRADVLGKVVYPEPPEAQP